MKTLSDIGKKGGEAVGELAVSRPELTIADAERMAKEILARMPRVTIEADTADGIKKPVEVARLPLNRPNVFGLVRTLADSELMVYASRNGNKPVMGMLSANYDEYGDNPEPGIKVIPLKNAVPLTSKLTPSGDAGASLAGAVSAERKGVGGHGNGGSDIVTDLEHKLTVMGAISLRNPGVALSELNHDIRSAGGSVATGLTDGRLGRVFTPSSDVRGFEGFAKPEVFHFNSNSNDVVYVPGSFFESEEAYGGYYDDAERHLAGVALSSIADLDSQLSVTGALNQIDALGREVAQRVS